MYTGSKFGPSEKLSLVTGQIIVHNLVKPAIIADQKEFETMNTEKKTWELDLKSWNIKKGKVLDNMCRLYLYLWNQCTLALKSKIKCHLKSEACSS